MMVEQVSERQEEILDPDLEICDPHHHLWHLDEHGRSELLRTIKVRRYLLPELLGDLEAGHNIVSTVFLDARAFYRASGPAALAPVGETEVVNGVAAMAASGRYGSRRVCAGIVSRAYLTDGDAVTETLAAHVAAGGGRFRGIRLSASLDPTGSAPKLAVEPPEHLYTMPAFQQGFARLREFDLSFDAWLYHPQIPDLIALARTFPDQPIVLDHVGTPIGLGVYAGKRAEVFETWRQSIRELATCPNVSIKLGGLGMSICGFDHGGMPLSSEVLADAWRPYIETAIEAFGVERSMFESNYPVDGFTCSYRMLWNALKRIAGGASADEKGWLFRRTAERFYRIEPAG